MSERTTYRRVLVMPLTVLLVAGGVWLWGSHVETRRARAIETTVHDLCAAAARGEALASRLPTASPIIDERLERTLADACAGGVAVEVTVARGAGPGASGGSASHHAVIRVDGELRLGLRFAARGDRPVIVGFWLPE